MPDQPEIRVGQIWADNDPRNRGRLIRVMSVHQPDDSHPEPYVRVVVEKVSRNVTKGEVGEQRTIRQRRLRPTRNGYRLVEDAPAVQAEPPYPDSQPPTGDARGEGPGADSG